MTTRNLASSVQEAKPQIQSLFSSEAQNLFLSVSNLFLRKPREIFVHVMIKENAAFYSKKLSEIHPKFALFISSEFPDCAKILPNFVIKFPVKST